MSRKRLVRPDPQNSSTEVQQDLAARLAQHGEAFMQMFDDDAPAPKRIASSIQEAALPTDVPKAAEDSESSDSEDEPVRHIFADTSPGPPSQRVAGSNSLSSPQAGRHTSKAERRRFMSGKAADIHHKPSPDQQQSKCPKSPHAGQAGSPLSRDDFLSMQKEVQQVGAEAMDRKARKNFDLWQLQSMRATPQKPGRVSAAIGKGMAKKQAERKQRAHDEAVASGMIKVKGSGKNRRSAVAEKGLLEDGGLFKAGMLRVKGPLSKGHKFKKGAASNKRAFSSSKIGDLNSNSQKAWNKAQERAKSKPKSRSRRPIR